MPTVSARRLTALPVEVSNPWIPVGPPPRPEELRARRSLADAKATLIAMSVVPAVLFGCPAAVVVSAMSVFDLGPFDGCPEHPEDVADGLATGLVEVLPADVGDEISVFTCDEGDPPSAGVRLDPSRLDASAMNQELLAAGWKPDRLPFLERVLYLGEAESEALPGLGQLLDIGDPDAQLWIEGFGDGSIIIEVSPE